MNLIEFDEHEFQHGEHYVYRYWNDIAPPAHQLLYVGFTEDFYARDRSHWRKSGWRRQATRVDIEAYRSRRSALNAEYRAITSEIPLYNVTYTDVGRWHELHREYMDAVRGRVYSSEMDALAAEAISRALYGCPA